MPAIYRPQPIPSDGVEAKDVATAATQQLKRLGQAGATGAGINGQVRTVTVSGPISSTDCILQASSTLTLTLPKVSEYPRNQWYVRRPTGAATVTVAARGSDTINGAPSITVTKMILIFSSGRTAWTAVILEN